MVILTRVRLQLCAYIPATNTFSVNEYYRPCKLSICHMTYSADLENLEDLFY